MFKMANLKKLQIGGVEISSEHANYMVNTNQATEEDVRSFFDAYFSNTFPDEFLDFAMALIQLTKWSN